MSSLSPQVSPVQNNTGKETFENKDVKKREILPKKKNKSLKICFGKKKYPDENYERNWESVRERGRRAIRRIGLQNPEYGR